MFSRRRGVSNNSHRQFSPSFPAVGRAVKGEIPIPMELAVVVNDEPSVFCIHEIYSQDFALGIAAEGNVRSDGLPIFRTVMRDTDVRTACNEEAFGRDRFKTASVPRFFQINHSRFGRADAC